MPGGAWYGLLSGFSCKENVPVYCLLFVLHSNISACIESMFTFMISREIASGIPISACPLLGTTKNTQHFVIFLNFMNTAHVPNCVILVLLYVQSLM